MSCVDRESKLEKGCLSLVGGHRALIATDPCEIKDLPQIDTQRDLDSEEAMRLDSGNP